MRHIRLISRLSMFILCFFVSLGALAGNEVALTVEKHVVADVLLEILILREEDSIKVVPIMKSECME